MNRIKTIITTDMEVDDMNSLIHLCPYLNEINLLGVIYTSSQYHFVGDGVHTLGEITPHYRCSGPASLVRPRVRQGVDPDAKYCKDYRPFKLGWIEEFWQNQYAEAYTCLIKHDANYPTVDYLMSITKYGNIEFEGDVRYETDGSNLIKDILLKEDEDLVYLQSWGGVNTIVRALLSIYETYHETIEWDKVYRRVCKKVRLLGVINNIGQDNSYLDNHMNELYPDLIHLQSEYLYGLYYYPLIAQEDIRSMVQGKWMYENILHNRGSLNAEYHTMGDGRKIEGEGDVFQFGLTSVIDFGKPGSPAVKFDKYDMCGEGDSNTYIPLLSFGLRGLENYRYGTVLGRLFTGKDKIEHGKFNPFLKAYQQDWAIRAKWCVSTFEEAVHAPILKAKQLDYEIKAGETVVLQMEIEDRDGRGYSVAWNYYPDFSCNHSMEEAKIEIISDYEAKVTIPKDAEAGDFFNITAAVRTRGEIGATAYNQFIISVI